MVSLGIDRARLPHLLQRLLRPSRISLFLLPLLLLGLEVLHRGPDVVQHVLKALPSLRTMYEAPAKCGLDQYPRLVAGHICERVQERATVRERA